MPNVILNVSKVIGESMTWEGYLNKIDRLLSEGLSTGLVQTPELLEKSKLNRHRIQRILKTTSVPVEIARLFRQLPSEIHFLVITEGWCGDAAQLLPCFNLLSESEPASDRVRYVLRDETDYINDFLTNGSRSIPVIIAYDHLNGKVISSWGPRPQSISAWYSKLKSENNLSKDELSYQLHARYSKDRGNAFFEDMLLFINGILSKV